MYIVREIRLKNKEYIKYMLLDLKTELIIELCGLLLLAFAIGSVGKTNMLSYGIAVGTGVVVLVTLVGLQKVFSEDANLYMTFPVGEGCIVGTWVVKSVASGSTLIIALLIYKAVLWSVDLAEIASAIIALLYYILIVESIMIGFSAASTARDSQAEKPSGFLPLHIACALLFLGLIVGWTAHPDVAGNAAFVWMAVMALVDVALHFVNIWQFKHYTSF